MQWLRWNRAYTRVCSPQAELPTLTLDHRDIEVPVGDRPKRAVNKLDRGVATHVTGHAC